MPSLAVANDQHAWNHTVNGVRVRSKIVPALIADEPVRPAQPRQVVPAVRVRAEPRQELAHRSRIVLPASECNHGTKSTPVKWRALKFVSPSGVGQPMGSPR